MKEWLQITGAVLLVLILAPFAIVGLVILGVVSMVFMAAVFFLAAIFTIVDLCVDLWKGVIR